MKAQYILSLVLPLLGYTLAVPHHPLPLAISQTPFSELASLNSSSNSNSNELLKERYDGEQVWRLDLRKLDYDGREQLQRLVDRLDLDIWKSTSKYLDLRIPESLTPDFQNLLPVNTGARIWIPNIQALIDTQTSPELHFNPTSGNLQAITETESKGIESSFHDKYHTLEELYDFGDSLVEEYNGKGGLTVEGFVVGKTFEGREIKGWRAKMAAPSDELGEDDVLELSSDDMDGLEDGDEGEVGSDSKKGKKGKKGRKPKKGRKRSNETLELVIQSGQHAREWVGPSTAIYFFHHLLSTALSSPSSSETTKLLQTFTFTIIPTINPDGYVYTHEHSRMWRKNRQNTTTSKTCVGIDLNSNWGYKWQPSRNPSACSDAYPGERAFEAFETRAMANYLINGTRYDPEGLDDLERGEDGGKRENRRVRAFVDLHSYGQLFMYPFAHSCDDFPPDAETLMEAGLGVAKAMRTVHGEGYQSGQACDLTYRAPGDAIDYSYGIADIRFSYSAELRDTGTYGFMLPPSLIRPTGDETTAGLLYLAEFIYKLEIVN